MTIISDRSFVAEAFNLLFDVARKALSDVEGPCYKDAYGNSVWKEESNAGFRVEFYANPDDLDLQVPSEGSKLISVFRDKLIAEDTKNPKMGAVYAYLRLHNIRVATVTGLNNSYLLWDKNGENLHLSSTGEFWEYIHTTVKNISALLRDVRNWTPDIAPVD